MYSEEERAKFKQRFDRWKAGEKPYKNGRISDEEYVRIMEKVAADNWLKWGEDSEDAALTRILNDNTYDYRGYYSKYPNSAANADTHWSDEFKTVWHPTFSLESRYSGKKSLFNPYGYPGGTWQGEFFNPQWYQLNPHSPGFYKDGYPKLPRFATGTEGNRPQPNIFQRSDGSFFYTTESGQLIDVQPLNTSLSDDKSMWTFIDSDGKKYFPKQMPDNQGTITQDDRPSGERFWDSYVGELKYDLKNDRIVPGKYTIPAIGAGALGGYLASIIGSTTAAAPTLQEAASLVGRNVWKDGLVKFGTSMLSGEAVNEGVKLATGSSWGKNINNISAGYIPEFVGDFTNPGYLFTGESAANKIANTDFSKVLKNGVRKIKKQITAKSRAEKLENDVFRYFDDTKSKLNAAISDALRKEIDTRHAYNAAKDAKYKETAELATLIDRAADKLKIRPVTDNDYTTKFIMLASNKRMNPSAKQIMKAQGIHKDLVERDDVYELILKSISEGAGKSIDFSKMSAKDVVRLIKQNQPRYSFNKNASLENVDLKTEENFEGLLLILKGAGVVFDDAGRVLDSKGVIPFDKLFQTGQFNIPLFGGGNVKGSINVTNPGLQSASVLSDVIKNISNPYLYIRKAKTSVQRYSANVPQEYKDALKQNIEYLVLRFGGAKPFGSSVTSAYADTPHVTHDIDLIMSEDDFVKNVESVLGKRNETGWRVNSKPNGTPYDDTYTYNIDPSLGDAGNIDFNIIYADPNTGMASSTKGTRAIELFKLFFPNDYRIAAQEALRSGNPIQINKTPKELIDAYNPVQKTILDALSSNKSKHISRAEAHLTTTNPTDVEKALDLYLQEKTGGLGQHIPVTKDMFYNVERNSRIFDDLGYTGVDRETVINDPLKMKNLVDYWYIHNSVYGRGVYRNTLQLQPGVSQELILDNAYREWIGQGGNANGAGLNAVTLGDSGYGDVYGYIQPNINFDSQIHDPEAIINFAKRSLGHPSYKFSNEDKDLINKILQSHNVRLDMSRINTAENLLNLLPSDISVKPILLELSDVVGIRSLQKTNNFKGGRYVSMTGRVNNNDAVSYDVRDNMEMPISDLRRDAETVQDNYDGVNVILHALRNVANRSGNKKLILRIKRSGVVDKLVDRLNKYDIFSENRQRIINRQLSKRGYTLLVDANEDAYNKANQELTTLKDKYKEADFLHTRRIDVARRAQRNARENIKDFGIAGAILGIPSLLFALALNYSKNRRKQKALKEQNTQND